MSYKNPECDNITKFQILTRQCGIGNKEVQTLTGCGKGEATKILANIHRAVAKETGKVPENLRRVSSANFLKYFGWSLETIKEQAYFEAKLQALKG